MSRFDQIDQATLERLSETASETAARSYSFLKIIVQAPGRVPDWKVVNKAVNAVVTDAEAIPRTDEAAMSYARFAPGIKQPVERTPWVLALGNKKLPRPNSFTDQSKWDKWPDGRPKDPWVFQTRIPLEIKTGELADRVVLFNGDTAINRLLIADLLTLFAEKPRRPLVLLTHETHDGEYTPAFKVNRLTEDDTVTPGLNHLKSSVDVTLAAEEPEDPKPGPVNGWRSDVDDEIPFR